MPISTRSRWVEVASPMRFFGCSFIASAIITLLPALAKPHSTPAIIKIVDVGLSAISSRPTARATIAIATATLPPKRSWMNPAGIEMKAVTRAWIEKKNAPAAWNPRLVA